MLYALNKNLCKTQEIERDMDGTVWKRFREMTIAAHHFSKVHFNLYVILTGDLLWRRKSGNSSAKELNYRLSLCLK